MNDPATTAFYEREAPRYAEAFGSQPSGFLDAFLDRLAPGASILELGCGGGRDAARMAERAFAVDPTDGSQAMVRLASARFGLPARQLRFADLDASERYDAVWASACLIHVARLDMPDMLARIYKALRSDGWHFASFKLGDGEGRDPLGRLHNFPDRPWLASAYCTAGFSLVDLVQFRGEGADGVVRDWAALTAKKGKL